MNSVINADVDLAHGLDRAPDADKAGFHHETVAGAVSLGPTALLFDFDETRNDVTELVGRALDRMRLAGRRLPDAGQNLLTLLGILRPGFERGGAGNEPLRHRQSLLWREVWIGVDRDQK